MLCKVCETIIPKAIMDTYDLCGPCMFKRGYCKNYYSCGRNYDKVVRAFHDSWLCGPCYHMFSMPLFTTEICQDSIIDIARFVIENAIAFAELEEELAEKDKEHRNT